MRRLAAGLLALSLALGATPAARIRPAASGAVRRRRPAARRPRARAHERIGLTGSAHSRPRRCRQAIFSPSRRRSRAAPIDGRDGARARPAAGRAPASKCWPTCSSAAGRRAASRRGSSRVTSKADAPDRYEIIGVFGARRARRPAADRARPAEGIQRAQPHAAGAGPDAQDGVGHGVRRRRVGRRDRARAARQGRRPVCAAGRRRAGPAQDLLRRPGARHRRSTPRSSASIPAEFAERVSEHSLVPSKDAAADFARAQSIFADLAPRTYNLDLGDFTDEHWSIEPSSAASSSNSGRGVSRWLTYTRSPGEPEDISLFDRAHGHNLSLYASAERLATRGRFYSEDDGADVRRGALHARSDVRSGAIVDQRARIAAHPHEEGRRVVDHVQARARRSSSRRCRRRTSAGCSRCRIAGQNNILVRLPRS